MSETTHALLGASSAHRWINCPGSALLTKDMPDTTSEYAAEGTLAHAVCEAYARAALAQENLVVSRDAQPLGEVSPEMQDCAEVYLRAINEALQDLGPSPYIALEQRVDYSRWVPEGFGTADCILIGGGILHVIDYKHGKGVHVGPDDNPQLMLYALGALERYSLLYDITTVRWSIVQPRNGGVSHTPELNKESLLQWAEDVVKPAAVLALAPNAPIQPGDWCRFCKARSTCRVRSDYYLELEGYQNAAPALLSLTELGEILIRAHDLSAWAKDIEDKALHRLLTGSSIPGWKAVEGRSVRNWTDAEAAFKRAIELGLPEEMLWERKPVTLAQLEKTMGKKDFSALSDFVTIPPGKPALAQESDKRPAITSRSTAEQDFAE